VRQADPETGVARTIVLNDDGSHRVFGGNTVSSLTSSSASDAARWAGSLTNHQLRGLVHEVGQRLLEGSRLYHARLAELERLGEDANYRFFGLQAGASEKDLDNAYRRLARQWHPDKNGGTEEAKRRFQNMKERYEALKKRRGEASEAQGEGSGRPKKGRGKSKEQPEEEDESPQNNQDHEEEEEDRRSAKSDAGDGEAKEEGANDAGQRLSIKDGDKPSPPREPERGREKSAVDSDDEDEGDDRGGKQEEEEKTTSIEYDPSNKDSMVQTVARMVKQLKNIEIQMKVLVKELSRAQSSFGYACVDS